MADVYRQGLLTNNDRFAITNLPIGGVIWGNLQPRWNPEREPAADSSSTIPAECLIDTGANWSFVSRQIANGLGLNTFDGPPPTLLEQPKEHQEPALATWITVVIGRLAIPTPAYVGIPPNSSARDAVIGTFVLRLCRFTYNEPLREFTLGPAFLAVHDIQLRAFAVRWRTIMILEIASRGVAAGRAGSRQIEVREFWAKIQGRPAERTHPALQPQAWL